MDDCPELIVFAAQVTPAMLTMLCRCVAAGDKDQEWGTSGASDRATSILVVCQRPPRAALLFRRRRRDGLTTFTERPSAELTLQCLELRNPQLSLHTLMLSQDLIHNHS